ncbi:uncharacterized protein K452DRAFT_276542 [Aplosporella prunicola CBS 121167]|uniref:Increased recombination centers protein 6 n=1 Tax=Aplosporella prunicola CBS 121167 TaxID=1176127 RepID=A0A6A6B4K3_9PEZI|nr:uncharacterized protein K452DRAFT_276542 [Aplosporella prunicola CBS 121167]KAF2138776.1 hypothetical protein K452DRAFT_276542 [Aplosporella prunicola CBS 121167]
MEITNPRRILCIGAPDSGVLTLLKELTGSAPTPNNDSTAGLSHTWSLKTAYYSATLPIWIDEMQSPTEWGLQFASEEAHEVVRALGAWVFCFRKPARAAELAAIKASLAAIEGAIAAAYGSSSAWDGVCVAVATAQGMSASADAVLAPEEWEDVCRERGFEFVDAEARGKNEFGEVVGLARVREALEANDWEGETELDAEFEGLDDFGDDEGEGDWLGSFAAEEAEMNMELMGMKTAVNGGEEAQSADEDDGGADDVEELQRMMGKMLAIKEQAAGLPEEQRKKFAAKAVNDLMKSN